MKKILFIPLLLVLTCGVTLAQTTYSLQGDTELNFGNPQSFDVASSVGPSPVTITPEIDTSVTNNYYYDYYLTDPVGSGGTNVDFDMGQYNITCQANIPAAPPWMRFYYFHANSIDYDTTQNGGNFDFSLNNAVGVHSGFLSLGTAADPITDGVRVRSISTARINDWGGSGYVHIYSGTHITVTEDINESSGSISEWHLAHGVTLSANGAVTIGKDGGTDNSINTTCSGASGGPVTITTSGASVQIAGNIRTYTLDSQNVGWNTNNPDGINGGAVTIKIDEGAPLQDLQNDILIQGLIDTRYRGNTALNDASGAKAVSGDVTMLAQTGSIILESGITTYNSDNNMRWQRNPGKISLTAAGEVRVDDDINASAEGGRGGDYVTVNASKITVDGQITTHSTGYTGRKVNLTATAGDIIVSGAILTDSDRGNSGEFNPSGGSVTINAAGGDVGILGGIDASLYTDNNNSTLNAGTVTITGENVTIKGVPADHLANTYGSINARRYYTALTPGGNSGALSITATTGDITIEELNLKADASGNPAFTSAALSAASNKISIATITLQGAASGGAGGTATTGFTSLPANTKIYYQNGTDDGTIGAIGGNYDITDAGAGAGSQLVQVAPLSGAYHFITGTTTSKNWNTCNWQRTTTEVDGGATVWLNTGGIPTYAETGAEGVVLDNNILWDYDTVADSVDGEITADLSGTGSFTKNGAGTLQLSGNKDYTGGTIVEDGELFLEGLATLPAGSDLTVNGDSLVDVQAKTLDLGTLNGDNAAAQIEDFTTLTVEQGSYAGKLAEGTFAASLTKTGNGTLTLSGVSSYTGSTNVNGGTLTVSGSLYDGVNTATLNVTGGTLNLNGSNAIAASVNNLTLNLASGANLNINNNQNLANLTLQLEGSYQGYTSRMVQQLATTPQTLTIAQGTPLMLTIDYATHATDKLTVSGVATIDEADLSVRLSGFNMPSGSAEERLTLIEAGTLAGHTTDWSTTDFSVLLSNTRISPPFYELGYVVENDDLIAVLTPIPAPFAGLSNPEAQMAIVTGTPTAGSPTEAFQKTLALEYDLLRRDEMVQQFTSSQSFAGYTASVGNTSLLLRSIASRINVPWDDRANSGETIRAQNNYYPSQSSYKQPLNLNIWTQSFGNAGSQASKDYFAGYDTYRYGFAIGGDFLRKDGRTLGICYAYTNGAMNSQSWDWDGAKDPAKVQSEEHTLLFYGIRKLGDRTFWMNKIGGSLGSVVGNRVTPETGSGRFHYSFSTPKALFLYQTTLGYNLIDQGLFSVTPKVKFSTFYYSQNGYTETCAEGNYPVTVAAFQDAYCEFDFLLDYKLRLTDTLACSGAIGYRSVLDAQGAVLGVQADGLSYKVRGMTPETDVLVCDIGMDWVLENGLSLVADYNYRSGTHGSTLHGGTATLVFQF